MNKTPRIVPAAILFFDCSRMLFLLTLLTAYLKPGEMFQGIAFPYMMCAAPNALFLLMSLFLFIRPAAFGAYIPLYITGKSLSLLCMIFWLLLSLNRTGVERIMWAVFLGLADLGTIMGMVVMGTEETNITETAQETVAETVSDGIIKEGGE